MSFTSAAHHDFNNLTDDSTKLGHCLPHLLEHVAETYLTNTAVICGSRELTYGELNRSANVLAAVLRNRGIGRGDLVGIALDRSLDLVVVLIAVLKSGAAYLPIDPSFPTERIRHILEDAEPKIVVVGDATRDISQTWGYARLDLDEIRESNEKLDDKPFDADAGLSAEDLAYVIYTSGSTGKPKGVEISHGALSNLLLSMKEEPGCDDTDRLLAITTISFDIAALELFVPLLSGGTTVLAMTHETRLPESIMALIQRHSITMMQATPATWQMLLDFGWKGDPRLSKILCGGEKLSTRLARRMLPCAEVVWNLYGPTEATVWASAWKVSPDEDVVIGRPVSNYKLYVLDAELAVVPAGTDGELYIGGAGLARGYRNKSELTRTKFIHNPFHEGLMYRSGDLARYDDQFRITVVGRADGQVKIRGHRIELGDIEATLSEHPMISDVVVVSKDERLIAYYIANSSGRNQTSKLDSMLRSWLTERLPVYSVPAFFVVLDAFPMTLNNKVDRNSLPDPAHALQPVFTREITSVESSVRLIWSKVLGHDQIGPSDNFFEVGGNSVLVVQVQKELEKHFARRISSALMFEHFTLEALSTYLETTTAADSSPTKSNNLQDLEKPCRTNNIHTRKPSQRHPDGDEEAIAVVGMSCRLPGNVSTPQQYWDILESGADVISEVPRDRWDADAIYSEDPDAKGKSYCRRGGFLSSVDHFDASFFGISPREATMMDPAQRIMLETSWESFERAGYTIESLRGSQTGVYIGTCNISAHTTAPPGERLDGYNVTGTSSGTMSGRISYSLGLEGPSMTIDTACASSLVTTHLACNALRAGECDVALSGGITLLLNPGMHIEFSRLQGISRDGRCRAFAKDSGGTGWAEGCTCVVLKRLRDVKPGETVHALIKGSAVNHAGRSAAGLTVPSGSAQQSLIRTALASSQLATDDIDYIETHGTGTKLGDPIEGGSLAAVFGGRRQPEGLGVQSKSLPLYIGSTSVKSQIGHTQAAAGLAGLLKVVLALKNGRIPRTLHATEPSLEIDWQSANMELIQQPKSWPEQTGRPRRAGVSAFGIGGTNAHVIVEECPSTREPQSDVVSATDFPFLLSAHSENTLIEQAAKLARHLESTSDFDSARLSYSLATTRTHFQRRIAILAKDKPTLIKELRSVSNSAVSTTTSQRPCVAMLFAGQGSQYLGMGRNLYQVYPVYRNAMDQVLSHFTSLDEGKSLREVMEAVPGSDDSLLIDRTSFAQPALFALEVALWELWKSWGVQTKLAIGHSVGELSAAYCAGVWNLADACRLVAARGRLMQAVPTRGSMVSLEASVTEVSTAIVEAGVDGLVSIAGHNTPTQTVASGDSDAIKTLITYLSTYDRTVKIKLLPVSHAFHSHHIDSILGDYQAVLDTMRFSSPTIPIVSTLTGKLAQPGQLESPSYWVAQARRAVCFVEGMQTLSQEGANIFIEMGPQSTLTGMGAACLSSDDSLAWLPSLAKSGRSVIQHTVTQLHVRRVSIYWHEYFGSFGRFQPVELPTYAFQRDYFIPLRNQGREFSKQDNNANDRRQQQRTKHDTMVTDRFAFEVSWQQRNQEPITPQIGLGGKGCSWGLLCGPCMDGEQPIMPLKLALSLMGIQLLPVANICEAQTLQIDGLLCFWNSGTNLPKAQVPDHVQKLTSAGLLQLQDAVRLQFQPWIVWVTQNAIGAGAEDDGVSGLAASPLWGLMRTARNEHPELRMRLIDLDVNPHDFTNSIGSTLNSMLNCNAEPECAMRQGRILVPRLQRIDKSSINLQPDHEITLQDGAVLITGGLGVLGRHVARYLVQVHHIRHLILTSRRGMEANNACATIEELTGLGAQVAVVACEMGDPESVKLLLASFNDADCPLRGVIHAAGAQDNGVFTALTPQRCTTTFAPKVSGAWYLHELTQAMHLDFFVMFSSISGIMGMEGHANYAAANTFLDALAHLRRGKGQPASSIAFGPWTGDGMASKIIDSTRVRLIQSGLNMLAPEDGLELLAQAISKRRTLTVAAALDLDRLQSYHEDRGNIPGLLRSLLQQGEKKTVDQSRTFSQTIAQAARQERPHITLSIVQETVASALGFTLPSQVDMEATLQDIGIDSLTAVLIRNRLAKLTGLSLPARFVFQHPNLRALSNFLLSELEEENSSASSLDNSTPNTTPSSSQLWLDVEPMKRGCLDATFTFGSKVSTPPETVFLTGATGFVGAFILHELLELGVEVHCLVRADDEAQGLQRLLSTLSNYSLWNDKHSSLLHPIIGDMALPLFGLTEDKFAELADSVDSICHSSAYCNWMADIGEYFGPNIVSAHEVLRLAAHGRGKAVHMISTMSTIPKYLGYDIREDDPEFGYATSKYTAERLMVAGRWRGAKVSIYRLPFVSASTATGHFRLDQKDFLHNLISGCLEMSMFPEIDADLSSIIPVDYVSRTVASIMMRDTHRIGQDFNFTNGSALSFNQFFTFIIGNSPGIEIVPFSTWRSHALREAASNTSSLIARIVPLLEDVTDDKGASAMVSGHPVIEPILGVNDFPVPMVTEESASRYAKQIRSSRKHFCAY
ncbi:nonribosomal peptide synthetase 7 [Pseudovirgaria hyperparasitica]|uniref:Nonribosomal peptide synthetase 7 n=1 Tax=Pseudovirgaria hyperparasitica TaxID=470096 RepID=A0A6A6WJ17_9PEZI|nr:nonribosomal peptide synthetase 7 [Pseudovirgaria hyperparasitica]KAF2762359.1 nonribosomal peptide synthetase 7 [Pseudovirgaria hyperparasitica]